MMTQRLTRSIAQECCSCALIIFSAEGHQTDLFMLFHARPGPHPSMGLEDKANSCCHVWPVKPVKNKCANIPSFQMLGIIDIPSFQDLRKSFWDLRNSFLLYLHLRRVKLVRSRRSRTPQASPTDLDKSSPDFWGGVPDLNIL